MFSHAHNHDHKKDITAPGVTGLIAMGVPIMRKVTAHPQNVHH